MAEPYSSFRDIIDLWPRRSDLYRDLLRLAPTVRRLGPKGTPARPSVRHWAQVDRIPPHWFSTLERAAWKRGFVGVTVKRLHEIRRSRAESNP